MHNASLLDVVETRPLWTLGDTKDAACIGSKSGTKDDAANRLHADVSHGLITIYGHVIWSNCHIWACLMVRLPYMLVDCMLTYNKQGSE